jgi:hypothetical protein
MLRSTFLSFLFFGFLTLVIMLRGKEVEIETTESRKYSGEMYKTIRNKENQ